MSEDRLYPGPCENCGATNYRPSISGPSMCRTCDVYGLVGSLRFRLQNLEYENRPLKTRIKRLKRAVIWIDRWLGEDTHSGGLRALMTDAEWVKWKKLKKASDESK